MAQPGHSDDAGAVGRHADRMAGRVAGRRDHHRTHGIDRRHRVGIGRGACAFGAEAQVQHPRRVAVVGHAGHAEPGRPAHAGNDVGVEAAALGEHAHRQDPHVAADARDADAVVGDRADQADRLRAVPRARTDGVRAVGRVAVDVGLGHPVAGVRGVGVAAVAVVGDRRVVDHVVSGQQVAAVRDALEVRMLEAHAGIEHRDDDRRVAGGDAPRRLDVDRRDDRAARRAQVPLASHRPAAPVHHRRALQVVRIVGRGRAMAPLVGHRVFDIALPCQRSRQRGRADAAGQHDLAALAEAGAAAQREADALAERLGAFGVARIRRQGVLAQQRRVGLELDDDPCAVGRDCGGLDG